MDVNTTRVLDPLVSYSPNGNSGTGQADGTAPAAGQKDVPATAVTAAPDTDKSAKPGKQVSRDSLQTMAAEMNKFMELLNTDIQFKVHERTHELMVRVVSEKDQC